MENHSNDGTNRIELAAAALEAARLADKELFNEKIARANDRISHEKEIRQLAETYNRWALDKQATEYERRLEALNHEADQLKSMQTRYWPRENAEAEQKRVDALEKGAVAATSARNGLKNLSTTTVIVLSIAVSLISIIGAGMTALFFIIKVQTK